MITPGTDAKHHEQPLGPAERAQLRAGTRTWGSGALLRRYRGRDLRPPERVLFANHAEGLHGRVLELGCGGGRITGHLLALAESVEAMDLAAGMVAYCARTYPAASFRQGDLREPGSWGGGPWDAIVAGWALIDVLGDTERGAFFDDAHRLLVPTGLLLFSSHNRASASLLRGPLGSISAESPLSLASQLLRLPRSFANHRRLARFERIERDYAILNGKAHDFSLLHYYITRDAQERQLHRHGFSLLECVDELGRAVGAGEAALGSHELHYAAQREAGGAS